MQRDRSYILSVIQMANDVSALFLQTRFIMGFGHNSWANEMNLDITDQNKFRSWSSFPILDYSFVIYTGSK